jgi:acyl carrier protein
MQPSAIVLMPALPLTANGKVDRTALPLPDPNAFTIVEYAAAQGEVEEAVVRAWRDILRIEQVGRYDDFVSLGGDSIAAMKLIVLLTDELHVQLAVDDVFRNSLLWQLAALIDKRRGASETELCRDQFEDVSF